MTIRKNLASLAAAFLAASVFTEFPAGSPGLEPREECGKFCDGLPFLSEGITLTACLGCALILIGIAATDSGLQKKD